MAFRSHDVRRMSSCRTAMPPERRDVAYRGYLIRYTLLGDVFIVKDQTRICMAQSADDARRQIDELLD